MIKEWIKRQGMESWAIFFLVGCLFLPNTKFYFLLSILFVLVIFGVGKSWEKVVIYGYWPLSVYYVGQLYVFQVIRAEELYHPLYPDGRSLYFKFTPLLVLGITMIITWIVKVIRERCQTNWIIVVLLVSVLTRLVSNLSSSGLVPWWVEMGKLVNNLSMVIWLWWVMNYLRKVTIKERMIFWKYISSILKTSIIIGSILVLVQVVRGSALGLVVEQRTGLPYTENGVGWLARTIGIWNHPNEAAYFIFLWLIAWCLVQVFLKLNLKRIVKAWLLIPVVALICLQSRAVFLGIVPIMFWGIFFYRKEINLRKMGVKVMRGVRLWLLMGILFLSIFVLGSRFKDSVINFGENSGWDTRQKLMIVASQVIKNHFWWGVGDGNYIPIAFREDKTGIMKNFPESVHQGGILILAEEGMVGVLVWLVFIVILGKYWWEKTKNNLKLRWLLIASLSSQYMVMIFQPFSSILTANVIVAVLLLVNYDKKYF
jgi:O-antigen ligase